MKAKEINEKIMEQCNEKMLRIVEGKGWDSEVFEVMSQAIKNLCDIEKLEKYEEEDKMSVMSYTPEVKENMMIKKKDAKTETTEFESLIYEICDKLPSEEAEYAYITIIAETMEDMRILHPKFYENNMRKLKEVLY